MLFGIQMLWALQTSEAGLFCNFLLSSWPGVFIGQEGVCSGDYRSFPLKFSFEQPLCVCMVHSAQAGPG